MYDIIIIGMGPSGMSASLYAKRSGNKVLLLEENAPGGLLNKVSKIENYLGFKSVSGSDLAYSMFEHIMNNNIDYKIEKVLNVENNNSMIKIVTNKSIYETKGLIIATGRKSKSSGILNEEKFKNHGISYCAICDAPLYKNKKIIVLGSDNVAFEESLYLSKYSSDITIISENEVEANQSLVDEVKNKNIKILSKIKVKEFIGTNNIEGIRLDNNQIINCDGVFIYYGYVISNELINKLDIKVSDGYILVDDKMKTNKEKIYACGDIIKKDIYQVSTAVSEGAIAALSLSKELKNN